MAGFTSHIDEVNAAGAKEYEALYATLCEQLNTTDFSNRSAEKEALLAMKAQIDTAAISSWSSLTREQRMQGLTFLSDIMSTNDVVRNVDSYEGLPPVLKRRADAIDYGVYKDMYTNSESSLKTQVALIITRADTRWGIDIKTRTLGYEVALHMLGAMEGEEDDHDFSVLERLEAIASRSEFAPYKAEMEQIVMKQACNQLEAALDTTGISADYKKLLSELPAITKDSRIPLGVRVAAMNAATAYADFPCDETKAELEVAIKAIPEHFTAGAGKSIFNSLWTTPKMTGFMSRINDTMKPEVHIQDAVNHHDAEANPADDDGYQPPVLGGNNN